MRYFRGAYSLGHRVEHALAAREHLLNWRHDASDPAAVRDRPDRLLQRGLGVGPQRLPPVGHLGSALWEPDGERDSACGYRRRQCRLRQRADPGHWLDRLGRPGRLRQVDRRDVVWNRRPAGDLHHRARQRGPLYPAEFQRLLDRVGHPQHRRRHLLQVDHRGASPVDTPAVFAIGSDNSVYAQWQNTDGSWSGWNDQGGNVTQISSTAVPGVGTAVFAVGAYNQAFVDEYTLNVGWSGWTDLGGYVKNVAGSLTTYNGLEVFAIGGDNAVYTQSESNGTWSGWTDLGGYAKSIVTQPYSISTVYAIDASNNIEVDKYVLAVRESSRPSGWSGFQNLAAHTRRSLWRGLKSTASARTTTSTPSTRSGAPTSAATSRRWPWAATRPTSGSGPTAPSMSTSRTRTGAGPGRLTLAATCSRSPRRKPATARRRSSASVPTTRAGSTSRMSTASGAAGPPGWQRRPLSIDHCDDGPDRRARSSSSGTITPSGSTSRKSTAVGPGSPASTARSSRSPWHRTQWRCGRGGHRPQRRRLGQRADG